MKERKENAPYRKSGNLIESFLRVAIIKINSTIHKPISTFILSRVHITRRVPCYDTAVPGSWKKSHKAACSQRLLRSVCARGDYQAASSPYTPLPPTPPAPADHIFHFMCDSWGNIETLAALWLDEKYTLKEPAGSERAIPNCIPVENVGKYCIMGVENCHPPPACSAPAKTVEYLFLMKTIYYSTWVGGNKDKLPRWRGLITANPRLCFLIRIINEAAYAYLPTSIIIYLYGDIVDILSGRQVHLQGLILV